MWDYLDVLYAEPLLPATAHQCYMHLLEAVLHKQTTPEAIAGWLNNHRLFSLFSSASCCRFFVGCP